MKQLLFAAILLIQSPNGTVTGRVLSVPGVPAVGVRVTAKPVAETAPPASPNVLISISQTDNTGRYRLENIPPGRYYITAGLVGSPTYYPGTAVLGEATVIDITAGSIANVPDFAIQQASVRPVTTPAPIAAQDPRYWLLPKLADPVSLDVVQDARASYEAIGKIAGVRVLFDRRIVPAVPAPFRAQGIDVLGALNLLSFQTGNTWTILGRDTISVVPSNFGISNLDLQLPTRDVAAAAVYPGFNPEPTGPLSFDIKAPSPDAFETIANMAGMSVVMDPNFRGKPIQLKLENADIYSALDILSAQDGAFWVPYDSKTILVSSDTASSHFDYDLWIVKMFHLSNLKSAQEIIDAGTALRKALSPRAYISLPMANAILVVDTPKTIALAEKLISDLDKTPVLRAETEAMDAAGSLFVVEPAGLRNATPYRTELQPNAGPFSLDASLPTRQAYEKFAESAGIKVVFDPNLRTFVPGQLQKLDTVDFFKALDLLSIQTHTFWIPLDSKTIFVASNNSIAYRDYQPQILKTFYLTHVNTAEGLNNIVNVVRLVSNSALLNANVHANAIIIRDNPRNMALAEMLIAQLDKDPSVSASAATTPVRSSTELETYSLTSYFIRDYSGRRNVNPARSQLQPAFNGPISIQMNENARASYETLARAAGLQVIFDSRFVPGNTVAFNVDNANIVDAINLLSLQTKTFWRVVDSKTILVAPPTSAIRKELEPQLDRTINLVNIRTPKDVEDLVVTIKLLALTLAVKANTEMNAIEIHDIASEIAIAEEIITTLDIP